MVALNGLWCFCPQEAPRYVENVGKLEFYRLLYRIQLLLFLDPGSGGLLQRYDELR